VLAPAMHDRGVRRAAGADVGEDVPQFAVPHAGDKYGDPFQRLCHALLAEPVLISGTHCDGQQFPIFAGPSSPATCNSVRTVFSIDCKAGASVLKPTHCLKSVHERDVKGEIIRLKRYLRALCLQIPMKAKQGLTVASLTRSARKLSTVFCRSCLNSARF